MKNQTKLRKFAPIVAVAVCLLLTAACNTNKKYGCPNHIQSSFSVR